MKTMMMFGRGIRRRCEECGNQAKKDCPYMRCRTCCKSKGFDCQTHVNSTWVPAYRRNSYTHSHHHNPKRLRTHDNPTTTSSLPTGLDGEFPGDIRSRAMTFRCVRVSSMMDDMVNEYAYEASVSIGGHLFKGILYDQGLDDIVQYDQHQTTTASTSAANVPSSLFPSFLQVPNFSETLNLN